MPKFFENLSYKFFIDVIYKIGVYLCSVCFTGAGYYITNSWIGAALLGIGSFCAIMLIKYFIEQQNTIDGKLLVYYSSIRLNHENNQLTVIVLVHNCSNQIIDGKVDVKNTRVEVNTNISPVNYSIDSSISIPPYDTMPIQMQVDLKEDNSKKLIVETTIKLKYGYHKKPKVFVLDNPVMIRTILKTEENGQIKFTMKN